MPCYVCRALAVLCVVTCAVSLSRGAIAATNVSYALSWTRMPGAETCVGGARLSRAVEDRLKRSVWVTPSTADVLIEGFAEKRTDAIGWHAHLVLATAQGVHLGQRDVALEEADCEALTQPLALMLALIIDPQLLLASDVRAPPPVAPLPAPEPPRRALDEPPPASAGNRRLQASQAQLGVGFAVGLLPSIATGLVLDEALPIGASVLELGGALWFPRETSLDANRGAMFSLFEIVGRFCPVTRFESAFHLRLCGGVQGGVMLAQGVGAGFSEVRSEQRPTTCLSASLQGGVHVVGPAWVGVRLSGLVPLIRQNFVYSHAGAEDTTLFRMAAVAGTGDLLLSAQF